MGALAEYAGHWLRENAAPIGRPNWKRDLRAAITEVEATHPSFARTLRVVALGRLGHPDVVEFRKAIAVLAIVGTVDDVAPLRASVSAPCPLEEDVRVAVNEIEGREIAGQGRLLAPGISPRRIMFDRVLAGVLGAGFIVAGIVAALFKHGFAPRLAVLLAAGSLGAWLLSVALTGVGPHEHS